MDVERILDYLSPAARREVLRVVRQVREVSGPAAPQVTPTEPTKDARDVLADRMAKWLGDDAGVYRFADDLWRDLNAAGCDIVPEVVVERLNAANARLTAEIESAAPQVAPEPERCPTCGSPFPEMVERAHGICPDPWHASLVEGEQG